MWSKLLETPVGYYAENVMRRNSCAYHSWGHVLAMFKYLEDNNYSYDIDLDAAILYHDSVYDDLPNKEARSCELFLDYYKMFPDRFSGINKNTVHALIMDTADHTISKGLPEVNRAIIRADLHALADGESAFINYHKIMNESIHLYGIDRKTFAVNNIEFMEGLLDRCVNNMHNDIVYEDFWDSVILGIKETIAMSSAILRVPA